MVGDRSDIRKQGYLEKSLEGPGFSENNPLFPLELHHSYFVHSQHCKASLCDITYVLVFDLMPEATGPGRSLISLKNSS